MRTEVTEVAMTIEEKIQLLSKTNLKIGNLTVLKERLESEIRCEIGHGERGQKKYVVGPWSVTIATGYNYSLDVSRWKEIEEHLPNALNPVVVKEIYKLDEKKILAIQDYGTEEENLFLSDFVSWKPKKLNMKVMAGI